MKRFIVTGAYGFIGSHFIDFLDNKVDAEIYIIDKKGYASNKNNLKKQYDTINLIHFDFDLTTSSTEIFLKTVDINSLTLSFILLQKAMSIIVLLVH